MTAHKNNDDRLRRILSGLIRVRAPEGFEERLARELARRKAARPAPGLRLRTIAIPGLAVLLVGVISLVVFRNAPDEEGGRPVETFSPRDGEGGGPPSIQVPATIPPASAEPSAAGEPAGKGEVPGASPLSMPSTRGEPPSGRVERADVPGPAPSVGVPKRARPSAARRSLMEVLIGDSGIVTDSLTLRDTVALPDSLGRTDSSGSGGSGKRDTLGLPGDTTAWRQNGGKPGTSP